MAEVNGGVTAAATNQQRARRPIRASVESIKGTRQEKAESGSEPGIIISIPCVCTEPGIIIISIPCVCTEPGIIISIPCVCTEPGIIIISIPSSTMTELLLDSNIRLWVVLPIVFITFFVGMIRHYVSILLQSDKKLTQEQVSDRHSWSSSSSSILQSFLTRKFYFNNAEDGFFKKTKRKVVPPSPMTDPTMLTDMMKGNVTNVLPMILIGGWINMTFSGFVTTKVPFPLTLRFKPMLQQGIELLSLDASWVSSASWYFLNVFGLRSIYSLILGQDNAADQSRVMQEQMTGAAMAMPADTNKAFKTEWEALELTDHQWALDDLEEELMGADLNFKGMFKRELQTAIF
ncbi:PREDICTED: ER membrane protein complex subunit 3-like [Nanorana parkeri]|uniref:ER membrane protein complex subunit 3-like n=1 Tax=Nanorana parkeri TaxID=125878 RepID=UPI000854AF71|nr:PREDICTED: ER membrane protein complex subunit 3-like [Nanorana parkeri]